ncbi:erythromycin esterase [Actinoplanes sp. NBRC 103695]|nr:erythromycin esterase [Actinoplanes sp. NBRC 103695]
MKLLPGRPRVLGLGEPTHFEDVLLEVRNDLFRQLVEQEGFRAIAIESDCLMGTVVDDYVGSGEGTLDEVMERGFSHGFGASAANRELVRWMRAYNAPRPRVEHVRFAGADGPLELTTGPASPQEALTLLYDYLSPRVDLPHPREALAADGRWTDPAAMMDPSHSPGRTPAARELRLIADDLAGLLDAQTPAGSREEWLRARMYARTAVGLLRYHHWMADTSPHRIARLLDIRSAMIAGNLLAAAAEWGPVLAFAHNSHLQRYRSSMTMGGQRQQWWSSGALVEARLGAGYSFLSMAVGTIRHRGVDTPPPDTIEGRLYARPDDRVLVDPRSLADPVPAARVSPWFGYAALDPSHLPGIDGVVYIKDCRPTQP